MAIRLKDTYTGQTDNTDVNYPYGKGINIQDGAEGTGTPFEKAWFNNLEGFLQGLLQEGEIAPNNVPDTANSSQLLQALKAVKKDASKVINEDGSSAQDTQNALKATLIAQGLSGDFGFFAKGFTYNEVGDVGIDVDGNMYTYAGGGTLPVEVIAGTNPVGDGDYDSHSIYPIRNFKLVSELKKDVLLNLGDIAETLNMRWEVVSASSKSTNTILLASGLRAKPLDSPHIDDFGAVGDFDLSSEIGTDNSQAIMDAVAISGSDYWFGSNLGSEVRLGVGEYAYSSVEITLAGVRFVGRGNKVSRLIGTSGGVNMKVQPLWSGNPFTNTGNGGFLWKICRYTRVLMKLDRQVQA